MLAKVRTPTGATCKGLIQLETMFINMKNIASVGLKPGSMDTMKISGSS